MRLYQFVWFILLSYMSVKTVESLTGRGSFWGVSLDLVSDDDDFANVQDLSNSIIRNKNTYLVLIGNDNKKYCYLYQPDAVIFSFGGSRRDIFEKTLLSLKVSKLVTVVSSDNMKTKLLSDVAARNLTDKWTIAMANKRMTNSELRRLDMRVRAQPGTTTAPPSTILFDLGDFSTETLRLVLKKYSRSCSQYILFNRQRQMTNLGSLSVMMQRAGYRRVTRVKSQRIATFVATTSPMWSSSPFCYKHQKRQNQAFLWNTFPFP